MIPVVIRPYEVRDRAAIRTLACETADRGGPVERFFLDREIFADLATRYYTDDEPRASWVADHAGAVVGYLTGCLESRRYWRTMMQRIVPQTALRALAHRAVWSRKTWRLVVSSVETWRRGGFRRQIPLDRYPAHLHVNVKDGFRGQRIGFQLVEQFLAQVRAAQVGGIHVVVRSDNRPACALFKRLGFTVWRRCPMMFPEGEAYRLHETVIYGVTLR
ncbi:MAG: GNAT family N-acetyltransferase [Candidatus Omnitrophica bacterium]|nr:GNAT family N-acetyltransferase [Candidatus Omnitrophota bacterium]